MSLEFLNILSQIPDPRRAQGRKWLLGPVLLATILAALSGATSYRKVHGFIEIHRKRLNAAFGFGWETAPAYNAIRTILQQLDAEEVERVFRQLQFKIVLGDGLDGDFFPFPIEFFFSFVLHRSWAHSSCRWQ